VWWIATCTGAGAAAAAPALANVNTTPRTPNPAAALWSKVDTSTADTAIGTLAASNPRISRCSACTLSPDPGTVTVTGNPPGDADPATPTRPPNGDDEPDPARSTVAVPADGHTGAAGADHCGICGGGIGCTGSGVVGTGCSTGSPSPGSPAAARAGGRPHTNAATNDSTKPALTQTRARAATLSPVLTDPPKIDGENIYGCGVRADTTAEPL